MKQRKCAMCKQKTIKKDKRKNHREFGKLICRWCAGMWAHDCH